MRKISQATYDRIDNGIYAVQSDQWWQPESAWYQMTVTFNPARVGYAKRKLLEELKVDPRGTAALEVGCGGGFLSEEIARMGFATTGVDPSERSIRVAADHARKSGLDIRYLTGTGESLPFEDRSFGAVFCCDVLEHVRDLPKVISEISRVLKPGGVFFYDTINRTWASFLGAIKIGQLSKRWAFFPPNLHVWRMFIKPREMKSLLRQNGLVWKEHRGMMPDVPIPRLLGYLRKRAKGEWTYAELAGRVRMIESRITAAMYMGFAVKKGQFGGDAGPKSQEGRDG
ncbi:MAG: bifunctional 2-polyprenyl-6-hydroxyphenol methylase/3-demethylubiquinol 3-O-methyltransferase UbiG [Candidatus Aminicenantes bacterium]|nr:bifunctional 2-polyprenyl-6-hydroxyphenol methylase/3-demethylubiquinol 3-O-methyltransferase UbiG [Candidatus Aminicenantes bacterium]